MAQDRSILLVADTVGWAWWHMFRGLQRYAPDGVHIDVVDQSGHGDVKRDYYDAVLQGSWAEAATQHRASPRNCVLLHHHGAEHRFPHAETGKFTSRLSTRIRNLETAMVRLPQFSCVLCMSERLLHVGRKFTERCVYCHPGVDHRIFCPGDPRPPGERLRVGWCGQFTAEQKGYKAVMKPVMERMAGHCEFVINGRIARDPLTQDDMVAFYRSCDVFLCTSFSEGTPMPPLEAMSCGVPVVSTNCGSVDEMVGVCNAGFVVSGYHDETSAEKSVDEICRALKWCAENRDAVRVMGDQARRRVTAKFSWQVRAAEWVSAILGNAA